MYSYMYMTESGIGSEQADVFSWQPKNYFLTLISCQHSLPHVPRRVESPHTQFLSLPEVRVWILPQSCPMRVEGEISWNKGELHMSE